MNTMNLALSIIAIIIVVVLVRIIVVDGSVILRIPRAGESVAA